MTITLRPLTRGQANDPEFALDADVDSEYGRELESELMAPLTKIVPIRLFCTSHQFALIVGPDALATRNSLTWANTRRSLATAAAVGTPHYDVNLSHIGSEALPAAADQIHAVRRRGRLLYRLLLPHRHF